MEEIKIVSHNIHGGLKTKLKNADLINYLMNFDIFILLETHQEKEIGFGSLSKDYTIDIEMATRNEVRGRASGGVMVGIRKSLNGKLELKESAYGIYITSKQISKNFVIIPKYLCFNKWNADFNKHHNMLVDINEDNTIIIGDLNARIGDHNTARQINNPLLTEDRKSKDKLTNKNGEKLIDLLNEFNMEIVNGRTKSDIEGESTFISKNGQSVIDLAVVSQIFLDNVVDFKIGNIAIGRTMNQQS